MDFNTALAHILISKGSVAHPRDSTKTWQSDRFGSYYGNSIEADCVATTEFYLRLSGGLVKVDYAKCGPSDFGQESRFNGTFTSSQLQVKYALFPVALTDGSTYELVAGINDDAFQDSFVKTLEMLSNWSNLSYEDALEQLGKRAATCKCKPEQYGSWSCRTARPELFSQDI